MKRILMLTLLLGCVIAASAGNFASAGFAPTGVAFTGSAPAEQTPASGRASEILDKLAAGFRVLGSYSVSFGVQAGDFTTSGLYDVKGEGYYMHLGDAEVFCDGKVRYEVDNARREVTVTGSDASSRNILNNPVHAFEFLDSQYTPSLVSEADGKAVVRLTPVKGSASPAGEVTVTIATASMRPLSLAYDFDGERVTIVIDRVEELKRPLRAFDNAGRENYEMIDFR